MAEKYEFTIIPQLERYYNEDSTWGVYTFITKDDIPQYYPCYLDPFDTKSEAVKGSSIVGKMQKLTIGAEYNVVATVEYNSKYKTWNYVPEVITSSVPKTLEQQIAFLKTQVTETQAKNILDVYPNIIEDILQNKEVDFNSIKGIGEVTWNRIKDRILDNYVISDILVILQPLGVSYAVIKKLIDDEPNPVLLKRNLIDNPYIMTKIHGLGFIKVDELALKLNPDLRVSEKRVISYVKYYLNFVGENAGHTWIPKAELDKAVRDNINECWDIYNNFISREQSCSYFLYFEDDKVGLTGRRSKELSILDILSQLDSYERKYDLDIDKGIENAENEQGFQFTDEQKEYLIKACQRNVVLISGLAGTGKTSLLRGLLNIYRGYSVACCALSAKAAQRITEATGHQASTIHRLLGFSKIDFLYNAENRLPYDVIVLDEASMVNVPIFYALVSAIQEGARVIICGDDGQLPPIGYGNIFHDLLNLDMFNSCKLTKILRQAEKSGIISDSKKIRNNENPLKYPQLKVVTGELQDMTYMFRDNREGMRELALKLYYKTIENDGIDDTIIIVPCKQNRTNSTEEINKIIQDYLIPATSDNYVRKGFKEFRVGAKVIQRANNYDKNVFNGEIGYIKSVVCDKQKPSINVDFGNNKLINLTGSELDSVELAYALTIHVTQGSGYKNVIAIVDNTHYKLLDSCLLYTALTRAKKKCLLIAEPSAYQKCISFKASERNTWLMLKSQNQ